MKSYFLLLRLNLRNLLAGFRGAMRKPNGKIDISRLILYPLALLGMLTLAGFVIFMEFSMFSAFEMLNAPEMLPGLAILLAMVTALLFSVFQMLAALYFSRDTASMAYLPLTSRTVLAAKWTEVYVSELLFSLLIAAPAVVLYGIHYAADWTYYLRMVPVLLAVNCIPLTISLLLASILGRFTSLTRHKEVWVVLGTVLMLVVVLGLEWSILPKIPEDADAAFFAQMLTGVQPMLRAFIHAFPPVAWAVDGIAGDWLQWLAFLAVSIGGVALAIALVGGSYLDTTLRQNEGSRKARRVRVTDKTFRAHSPFMAIYRREWNEILKVPVYLLNGVLGAMMLPKNSEVYKQTKKAAGQRSVVEFPAAADAGFGQPNGRHAYPDGAADVHQLGQPDYRHRDFPRGRTDADCQVHPGFAAHAALGEALRQPDD